MQKIPSRQARTKKKDTQAHQRQPPWPSLLRLRCRRRCQACQAVPECPPERLLVQQEGAHMTAIHKAQLAARPVGLWAPGGAGQHRVQAAVSERNSRCSQRHHFNVLHRRARAPCCTRARAHLHRLHAREVYVAVMARRHQHRSVGAHRPAGPQSEQQQPQAAAAGAARVRNTGACGKARPASACMLPHRHAAQEAHGG